MSADDYILGDWKTFICAYCGCEIPNDIDYINTYHSGNCKKEKEEKDE